MGVPCLGKYFDNGAEIRNPLDEDGTTVKSDSTKSHFVWDHGKCERHFIHGSSHLPELIMYVGHGYFNAFCTRVQKLLGDKVHYAFSSAYSVEPETAAVAKPNPHIITSEKGDLDNEEPLHKCYNPNPSNKSTHTSQSIDDTPPPTRKVTWSSKTKHPAPDQPKKSAGFQLGMDLMHRDGQSKNLPVVY